MCPFTRCVEELHIFMLLFCAGFCEKFVNFEKIFVYEPCLKAINDCPLCFSAFTQITNRDLDIGVGLADDTATLQVESFHVSKNSALVSPAWLYSLQTSARNATVQDVQ